MSDFRELYNVRDGKAEDANFIMSTFLRGLYYGESWFSQIPKDIFMNNYKIIAVHMIAKSVVKVACLPDDPDTIIGYSILSPDFMHIRWVYVKKNWRKNGVAKSLVPKHPLAVNHLTAIGKELLSKLPGAVFNPFI